MKVGIIGMGVVGEAQVRLFEEEAVVTYDPATDEEYPQDEIAACDFAIVCVGTPEAEDGSADLEQVLAAARALPLDLPVMLRSTVPPGTTDLMFTGLRCHVPEFMGESPSHPWRESWHVPYMILGGDGPSRSFFKPRLEEVYSGDIHECSAVEAELAKYISNLYWATRVTFVNEMAAICGAFDVDYEKVRDAWLADERLDDAYTRRAGFPPGFGGRCWPKDLAALIHASLEAGHQPAFLEAVQDSNRVFRS